MHIQNVENIFSYAKMFTPKPFDIISVIEIDSSSIIPKVLLNTVFLMSMIKKVAEQDNSQCHSQSIYLTVQFSNDGYEL